MPAITTLPGLSCRFEDGPPSAPDGVLAVISHGYRSEAPSLRTGSAAVGISVPEARAPGRVEVWRTGREVTSGHHDGLVYAHDGRHLLCSGRVPHDEHYADAIEDLYLRALALVERAGYPEVARIWNIVGGITGPVEGRPGTDRYGEFCEARARAFRQRGLVSADMPAATGIGGHDDQTTVYLLASRAGDVVRIENPQQVPAYEYPHCYGAEAPSFARATYVRSDGAPDDLFISGTASIVGHRTVHVGDAALQTHTTLANVAELLSGANLRRHGIDADVALHDLDCVKVYVKRPRDLEAVRRVCESVLDGSSQVVYAIADVCREDLLVQIEAFVAVPER